MGKIPPYHAPSAHRLWQSKKVTATSTTVYSQYICPSHRYLLLLMGICLVTNHLSRWCLLAVMYIPDGFARLNEYHMSRSVYILCLFIIIGSVYTK